MPGWLVTESYRLMLRHGPSRACYNLRHSEERPRVHRNYTVFGSMVVPPPQCGEGGTTEQVPTTQENIENLC